MLLIHLSESLGLSPVSKGRPSVLEGKKDKALDLEGLMRVLNLMIVKEARVGAYHNHHADKALCQNPVTFCLRNIVALSERFL